MKNFTLVYCEHYLTSKIFIEQPRYAYEIQKHTKRTLFHVFECLESEVRHCVSNLVKEHSSA